jgi:multicomponent K+:H+ antiporter subunit A
VIGLVVSLAFVRFSAPDLSLTQLLVEIVTVMLLLLAMYFLPARSPHESSVMRRARDVLVAVTAGGAVGALTWALLTRPLDTIAWYYLENAKPAGGGYNVVNVILVDFRGFDTLGEITVLGIAAVGIVALLHNLKLAGPGLDWDGRPWAAERYPLMLSVLSRPLLPLALLVSAYLFLRGHNAPGGGFIAGLVTGTAIILQYVAYGSGWVRERLPWSYSGVIATGLLVAVATGLASWAFGAPFLTSTYGYVTWPVVGKFELASAMVFDLGIYLAVVGTVLVIISRLGRLCSTPSAISSLRWMKFSLYPRPQSPSKETMRRSWKGCWICSTTWTTCRTSTPTPTSPMRFWRNSERGTKTINRAATSSTWGRHHRGWVSFCE